MLRLALNSLYLLSEDKRAPALVKAVFELRSLTQSGYMPDLFACAGCGLAVSGPAFFDVTQGCLYCGECAPARQLNQNLNGPALAALRHIVLQDDSKLFSFALAGESLEMLTKAAEAYTLFHLDWPPKTLNFLKNVL
jgi:DNA repair protein RecO (recombination protein O)